MTKIKIAENSGFCFGVKTAVKTAHELLANDEYKKAGKKLVMLGELTHNKSVVDELKNGGFMVIDDAIDVPDGAVVLVRAHGVTPKQLEILESKKCIIYDRTCPFVAKIHKIAAEQSANGKNIIITGTVGHPEVVGICGEVTDSQVAVVSSIEDLANIEFPIEESVIISQTTFSRKIFKEICLFLKNQFANISIFDTICSTTCNRQREAFELAGQSDVMLVIGSSHSSNTKKLFDICVGQCGRTFLIDDIDDLGRLLDDKLIKENDLIGVTAGASTPNKILLEVVRKMSENEAMINQEQPDIDFGDYIDNIPQLRKNAIVKGVITSADDDYVYVDVRDKSEGKIRKVEFDIDPDFDLQKAIEERQEIEVQVRMIKNSDAGKEILLSKQALEYSKNKEAICDAYENKKQIPVKIVRVTKKNDGIIGVYSGIEVYIHKSQIDINRVEEEDLPSYVGKELIVVLTKYDDKQRRLNVSGSRKAILAEERKAKRDAVLNNIAVGNVYQGVVKNFASFGAFVDIGGFEAVVYNEDASWERGTKASDVLEVGQEIEVTVSKLANLDTNKPKVYLVYKKPEDDPYYNIEERMPEGSVVRGKVVRIKDFGAFVELEPGVDAMCHVSQISNKHLATPADVLSVGMEVTAMITQIRDRDVRGTMRKEIVISIRDVAPIDPEDDYYVADDDNDAGDKADDNQANETANAETEVVEATADETVSEAVADEVVATEENTEASSEVNE